MNGLGSESINLITIVIPTKNHHKYIQTIINMLPLTNVDCNFLIMDSSDEDFTKKAVEDSKIPEMQYVHVPTNWTPDQKSIHAVNYVKTKYIWLVGDGLLIDYNYVQTKLCSLLNKEYDYIHLVNVDSRHERKYCKDNEFEISQEYTNTADFFNDFFWTSTFMGSLIITTELANNIVSSGAYKKYLNTGFALICSVLDFGTTHTLLGDVEITHYFYSNPQKKESAWISQNKIYDIWANEMIIAIQSLPVQFEKYKKHVLSTTCTNNGFFTAYGMIGWRSKNKFDKYILNEYRENLIMVSGLSNTTLNVIANLPIIVAYIIYSPILVFRSLKRKQQLLKDQ